MSTVITAMKKLLDMSMDAGQEHAIQAFDQQLYAIAQQVKWSRPDILEPHVLRLCGFHSLSTFIWADGGLRDLYTGVEHLTTSKRSMTCSGIACLISILISVKYLHDQEICY